ncbi:hypothetical protein E4T50_12106 [Aureobasidium sp. EXF-12298]|nr:hypothetical protein E4T50_12106 [Aureobasidium sp. EXF-12298]
MYTDPPRSMERVSRRDIFTSLPARVQWLHSFLEFGTDDVQALISGQKYIKAVIPAIVNIVYKKLLKYDITARVFTTRNSRDEGPVESWPTEDSAQIEHRKMEYLDKVGLMHVGRGRQNPLHVDYVFLGACLGFIQDSLFEAILSHPRLEMHRKIAIVKALGKVSWIQNDLIERWHNTDGSEFLQEEADELLGEIQEEDREGYLHGKKILGDDGSSIYTSRTRSSKSSDSGKTSLGRPIEEATHLGDGISRCPFSGMARTVSNPAELDRQRATSTRSPRVNGTAPDVLQQYHSPGTPRIRIIDGKTVLKENLEPLPKVFESNNLEQPTHEQLRQNQVRRQPSNWKLETLRNMKEGYTQLGS